MSSVISAGALLYPPTLPLPSRLDACLRGALWGLAIAEWTLGGTAPNPRPPAARRLPRTEQLLTLGQAAIATTTSDATAREFLTHRQREQPDPTPADADLMIAPGLLSQLLWGDRPAVRSGLIPASSPTDPATAATAIAWLAFLHQRVEAILQATLGRPPLIPVATVRPLDGDDLGAASAAVGTPPEPTLDPATLGRTVADVGQALRHQSPLHQIAAGSAWCDAHSHSRFSVAIALSQTLAAALSPQAPAQFAELTLVTGLLSGCRSGALALPLAALAEISQGQPDCREGLSRLAHHLEAARRGAAQPQQWPGRDDGRAMSVHVASRSSGGG